MWDQLERIHPALIIILNHSHVCGINRPLAIPWLPRLESFPRMWDQLRQMQVRHQCHRIIPTYVGSTRACARRGDSATNHSHVCGINRAVRSPVSSSSESFPRMWDQLIEIPRVSLQPRIIPTYVGSTVKRSFEHFTPSNHSHVCGINDSSSSPSSVVGESFPRMWDQPHATMPEPLSRSNHSHVCGINNCILIFCSSSSESFPRMWDQRGVYPDSFQISRIIPTYVGSTDS